MMAESKRKTHKYDELYLQRILPQWNTPGWLNGDVWRSIVRRQMLAMICRDTLITQVLQPDPLLESPIEAGESG